MAAGLGDFLAARRHENIVKKKGAGYFGALLSPFCGEILRYFGRAL
jgi:hypothetical protein